MIQKKYRAFVIVFSIIIAVCFVCFVVSIIRFSQKRLFIFLFLIAFSIAVFRLIQDNFYKKGYFSEKQARLFFEECSSQGIKHIQSTNFDAAKAIYDKTVATVYFEESNKTITLLNKIYFHGKKQGGDQ